MKLIPLSKGGFAKVDDEDFDRLQGFPWRNTQGYAAYTIVRSDKQRRRVSMHRVVMNAPDGSQVDHRNTDTMDNQKSNLRLATNAQNQMNRGMNSNNKSGVKGVYWVKRRKKWRANIRVNYELIDLGVFSEKTDAAKAYEEAAKKYHGEFARVVPTSPVRKSLSRCAKL